MAKRPLLQVRDLRLSLGGAPLFSGVDMSLLEGERACLVGANGAGKSTLLRILAGLIEADSGERALTFGASLAFVAQEPDLAGHATLRDYAMATFAEGLAGAPAHRAEAELEALGLDTDRAANGLSGGETRRAALARAFAAQASILLLDEPTNHLDIIAIEQLEHRLKNFRGAALIISHDRRFLERVSTATFWLRQRKIIKNEKGFAAFDDWAEAVELEEQRALAKLETQLRAEEHWLQRGVTARRSRNEGRRRKLLAMRAERRERKRAMSKGGAQLAMLSEAQSGRLVIEAADIAKSFPSPDGLKPVVRPMSLRIFRGDRVGIVGPNGAGKSTLLEMLLKRLPPDQGAVRHGANLEIAYVDQQRSIIPTGATIWDALTPLGGDSVVVRGRSRHVAAYAKDFLFGPEQLRQPASALSGGERNRLALALALARPANLLVLDEPTNDLDADTLDLLEQALSDYDGTVLIVSHDRAFLDGATTQILGSLGDGVWVETPGGFEDFEREHGGFTARQTPPPAAAKPAAAPPAPAEKRAKKLSYKDERRLGELEALVPKLEADIQTIEAQLAAPGAYEKNPAAYNESAQKLEELRARKDAAELEWLELDDLKSQLAG